MARRKKAQPLTPSQLQVEKDVKRINERINEVAKAFGTDSFAYNQWYSALKLALPEKYRQTSKHGIIQVKRSKELYLQSEQMKIAQGIKRLLGMKTKGELMKEAKKSLIEEGEKKPTRQDIQEQAKKIDLVNTFVSEHEDMFYIEKKGNEEVYDIIHTRGRKKTYDELKKIIDAYNKAKGAGKMFKDIFAGLE